MGITSLVHQGHYQWVSSLQLPVVPHKAVMEVSKTIGEVGCCESRMAERIH